MANLSLESIQFLKKIKAGEYSSIKEKKFHQAYTQLFCELFDVIREVKSSLEEKGLGIWTLTYKGAKLDKAVSYKYNLRQKNRESTIDIDLSIDPFGTTSLTISSGINQYDIRTAGFQDFFSSPAFKRYFAPLHKDPRQIQTIVPQKQITSRHFGDYIIHLCHMAIPYIISSQTTSTSLQLVSA